MEEALMKNEYLNGSTPEFLQIRDKLWERVLHMAGLLKYISELSQNYVTTPSAPS